MACCSIKVVVVFDNFKRFGAIGLYARTEALTLTCGQLSGWTRWS